MLDGKKYLLVLDDVWSEDPLKWSRLKNMLIGGGKGSKILLTTRSDVVTEVSGSAHQQKLGDLSEEEAWILFEKMAFGCNKESENSNLVEIGKEIVRMCGGFPLAISYNHLPQHLKICFAYCSLYPKDFKIGRFDLITMWIAQGFIQATTSNTDNVEDVANSYFTDLLRRSFFQETEEHESFMQFYKMHDLIHDIVKEVADRDFFSITETEDTEVVPEQTLYASCLFKIDDSSAFPNSFNRMHMKLRAFIFLNQSPINVLSNSTLERMISSFSRLRLLHLGHLKIEFPSQSLGGLKHLRYRCIFSWSISTLPNSITKLHNLQVLKLDDCEELHNLQVLKLDDCEELKNLPRDIWRLVSLRYLDGCSSLEDMPPGIGQLTSLRTLTSFIIGKESCTSGQANDKLNELKGLVDLRNSLSIKFMGRVRTIGERTPTGVVKRCSAIGSFAFYLFSIISTVSLLSTLVFDYFVHEDRANQFYLAIRKYYPGLKDGSLEPGYAGIRPKLVGPEEGSTDFVVQKTTMPPHRTNDNAQTYEVRPTHGIRTQNRAQTPEVDVTPGVPPNQNSPPRAPRSPQTRTNHT
ncbi:hypothetical protein CQW23_30035 [Capsicum baccatum]|uniref:Uncharacterized protein n=1 Tax=Capsicum baccatum TaxID=33114 RepID=A0A2G2VBJ9_CAPBA|nr:hypothetical protein CQW23_30035 [Capsicum baccatum]